MLDEEDCGDQSALSMLDDDWLCDEQPLPVGPGGDEGAALALWNGQTGGD